MNVGKAVGWMRRAKNLTTLALARKAGMHEVQITRIEEASADITLLEAGRLADALHVPLVVFMYAICEDEEKGKLPGDVQRALSHQLLESLGL